MSFHRRSSVERQDREEGHLRGPNGRRLCRFCKKEVPLNRRTFCSDDCVNEWKLRSDPKFLRKRAYERDLGICAECSLDTRMLKIEVENTWRAMRLNFGQDWARSPEWLGFLKLHGLRQSDVSKSLWQADHINPVVEGGGECGLENIRTLCLKCHRAATRALAKRRTKK